MADPVLVELCAGSAAVSLRWLHPRAKPPIAYQGGKRAYADAILLAMGLRPGGGYRSGRVVLVEAGPWGEAWAHWAAGGIADTVERLRARAGEDPRALWERLADAPVPMERNERVAAWAYLQYWAFGGKAVLAAPRGWTARAAGFAQEGAWRDDTPTVAAAIAALADLPWSRVQVMPFDALEVDPLPGAHVYIDPPYHGTTGYGWHLSRDEVIGLASRWRAAGCEVTVSEAEPLALDDWHHHQLGKPHGNRRTWSKQQSEWLTLSHPPVGVLDFGRAG